MSTKKTETISLQKDCHPATRRAFLRDGFLAAGVIGFGIREVLGQARQAGKPALTAAALNRLTANSSEAEYREMCREAQADLRAFVRKAFYLTAEQEKALDGLTTEQVQKIQRTVNRSLANQRRYKMFVTYESSRGEEQSPGTARGFTVVAVRDQKEQAEHLARNNKKKEAKDLDEEAEEAATNFFQKVKVGA